MHCLVIEDHKDLILSGWGSGIVNRLATGRQIVDDSGQRGATNLRSGEWYAECGTLPVRRGRA